MAVGQIALHRNSCRNHYIRFRVGDLPLALDPRRPTLTALFSRTGLVYIFCLTRLSLVAKSRKHCHDNALDTGGALRAPPTRVFALGRIAKRLALLAKADVA